MKQPWLDKDDLQIVGSYLLILISWIGIIAFTLWLNGYHVTYRRPDWQLFGCRHTYVNDKGEDTGECE